MQTTSYPTQPGVQGQTVYVHQPAPVNYATTVQNPNSSSGVSQNFNGAAGRATGWLQLSLGIGCIVVAIPELVLGLGVGFSGMGIWASVLFYIPTGILGICSMQKNTCVIVGYLTMCIITANVAFVQMLLGAIGAGITSVFLHDGIAGGSIAIDSLLAILGLIEMIVAIVASAYCCGGMACCNSSSQTTTTMYTQLDTPMVVTTGQYNVQQAYPPAGQPVAPVPYNQAPGSPYNHAPGAPNSQAPVAPYNQAPGAPYNQAPAAPYNQAPAAPNNQAPVAPYNQAPGAPYNQAPAAPYNQALGAPNNQAPVAPYNQAPGAPYNQAPAAPYNQAPGAPYNQTPAAPYNQAPAAPYNQAPGAPYNQQAAAAQT